uniref:XIAP associated factor 1 n=1 Tax=Spermophilus dauricus TaxID=99837 RepID=A0A8C9P4N2_SPEDA
MEGDFQVCGNCRRSVASDHFTLHEAHCLRFLVLCPECEEPIPKSKMKEHFENEHQQVSRCVSKVQKLLLELHAECQQDSIKCKFCELTGSLKELQIHESRCDKQTECCLYCGQFIRLQVLAQHQEVCPGRQAQLGKGEHQGKPGKEAGSLKGQSLSWVRCKGLDVLHGAEEKGVPCVYLSSSAILVLHQALEGSSCVSAEVFK